MSKVMKVLLGPVVGRATVIAGLLIAVRDYSIAQTKTPEAAAPPTATVTPAVQPTPRIVRIAPDPLSPSCDQVTPPVLVNRIEPEYTEDARKGGLQGRVVLEAIIARDGSVQDVRVTNSVTDSLDQSAMRAVRQWRYTPALCGDRPVRVYLTINVTFNLKKKK